MILQVADVRKPLVSVPCLLERGHQVVLALGGGESYIYHLESKTTVPVKKKGGSFVIEAHFVRQVVASQSASTPGFARPP